MPTSRRRFVAFETGKRALSAAAARSNPRGVVRGGDRWFGVFRRRVTPEISCLRFLREKMHAGVDLGASATTNIVGGFGMIDSLITPEKVRTARPGEDRGGVARVRRGARRVVYARIISPADVRAAMVSGVATHTQIQLPPGYALRYHSPTRLVRTYFRTCLCVLRRDARRNTQGGAAADAGPRLSLPASFLYTLLRRRGYDARLPASCVRRLRPRAQPVPAVRLGTAIVKMGRDRADKWNQLASPVPARRANNLNLGGTSLAVARARTHLARSIFSPMCLFPSISAATEGRDAGGQRGGGRGPAMPSGVATDTHQVSDRSARYFDVLPVAGARKSAT